MNQPTVLILADDAEFARTVIGRWQAQRSVPSFTVVSSDVWNGANSAPFDLAVVGEVRPARLTSILKVLDVAAKPVLCTAPDLVTVQTVRENHPRIVVLQRFEGWVEHLVLLGSEMLRRLEAVARARRAEQAGATAQRLATLGKYMLETRHGFNNAMTSVLGNAELLLLDPKAFTPEVRDQIETIHTMALRMHEIMQRFSSLDAELLFAEKKEAQAELKAWPAVAGQH